MQLYFQRILLISDIHFKRSNISWHIFFVFRMIFSLWWGFYERVSVLWIRGCGSLNGWVIVRSCWILHFGRTIFISGWGFRYRCWSSMRGRFRRCSRSSVNLVSRDSLLFLDIIHFIECWWHRCCWTDVTKWVIMLFILIFLVNVQIPDQYWWIIMIPKLQKLTVIIILLLVISIVIRRYVIFLSHYFFFIWFMFFLWFILWIWRKVQVWIYLITLLKV